MDEQWGFETKAIHSGQAPEPETGAVVVPIFQTSTYAQEALGRPRQGYEYSRTGNPTRKAYETCIAALEGGAWGLAFASGMAAINNCIYLLKPGDHVVCSDDVYGGTYRFFSKVAAEYGIRFDFVDLSQPGALEKALQPATRMVWVETPTNPMLRLTDLSAISKVTQARKVLLVVDNTFMSPYLQRPLSLGADLVVHSATKYLAGHADVVNGCMVGNDPTILDQMKFHQNAVGAIPGPFDCWLVMRGLKTLAVRMDRHCANAIALAKTLESHPGVARVHYPGLPSHPQHALAQQQMRGFGGMLSFEVRGGAAAAQAVLESVQLFLLAESLGGVESLIELPAIMTHASIPAERRAALGITDGLIRLSVGLESLEDLQADLTHALSEARQYA
ncbi:MAG TPA: cystathionine gamma-synthase [Candidatus Xenobia bacterium]|jgi:cystathionine beta-lyase/cystathionine gamma-synthase